MQYCITSTKPLGRLFAMTLRSATMTARRSSGRPSKYWFGVFALLCMTDLRIPDPEYVASAMPEEHPSRLTSLPGGSALGTSPPGTFDGAPPARRSSDGLGASPPGGDPAAPAPPTPAP